MGECDICDSPAETVVLADAVEVKDGNLVFYRKPHEICHIVVHDQWSEVKLIENTAPASNAAEPERRWPIKP